MSLKNNEDKIKKLEEKLSELTGRLEEVNISLEEEQGKRQFYQFVADFTFGWELWLDPDGKIKYCSPSCIDLTGYSSNQIIVAENLSELLVYEPDREKFDEFILESLNQMILYRSLEFRILTMQKQLRWCSANVRGVYNKQGRYLGIRASIQDITRLKKAMGHISNLTEEKELENKAKLRIKSQLDDKERELISFLLQLSRKNEIISHLVNQIKKFASGKENNIQHKLKVLVESVEKSPSAPLNWNMVESEIENLHPGFFFRLLTKHPNLTTREKKLSAFLRLGLSSKEISGLQNVTHKSVEIARVRLRRKIKLPHSVRLTKYIESL